MNGNKLTDYDAERKKLYNDSLEVRDLHYCKVCGRVFAYPGFGPDVCQDCRRRDQEEFDKVREYLSTHEHSSVHQTSLDTGISMKKLYRWIHEERLYFKDDGTSGLFCEICGEPINTGRYCRRCKAKLKLKGVMIDKNPDMKHSPGEKMRFIRMPDERK